MAVRGIGVKYPLKSRRNIKNILRRETYWALRDVTFSVNSGDILFVIGRNGAGKSTLLKVLSETLHPDEGEISLINCRKSFVSMGMGFRPELSGISNIEISLRLMGLSKSDITQFTAEIIEFSELENYIYEPILSYSAGMRARLAFSVATSIKPDILIMDEVINTGDEVFQRKSKLRINEMLNSAKVVIVCTHNLKHLSALATKALWLEQGRMMSIGCPKKVSSQYLDYINKRIEQN